MTEYERALRQIDTADLGDATYRAARRLLDAVGQVGHIKLTRDAIQAICHMTSYGSVRRALGTLQKARIIHYSTNDWVYVDFTAWQGATFFQNSRANSDHPRANFDHPRANSDHDEAPVSEARGNGASENDHPRANFDHPRANFDHPRANFDHEPASTYTHAHARGACLLDLIPPSLEEDPASKQASPDDEGRTLALALLTFARVRSDIAQQLASAHALDTIREAICEWWMNRKSMGGTFEETPGIVVHWLNNWANAGVPALPRHFFRTDLYRRFRTTSERQADAASEPGAPAWVHEPADVLARPSDPIDSSPADPNALVWAQALAEMVATLAPGVTTLGLDGARLLSVEADVWRIGVRDPAALTWLRVQATAKVRRTLSSLLNRSVTVEFCLMEQAYDTA
jgi:hypothetical protein